LFNLSEYHPLRGRYSELLNNLLGVIGVEMMRLQKARIQKYRSIRNTGVFDIENGKTILVGPNEAGKTVLLNEGSGS